MKNKKFITIIAPMCNEELIVEKFYKTIIDDLNVLTQNYSLELIFIDDGSSDKTLNIMKQLKQKHPDLIGIVSFSRNFGLEAAVFAGLKVALGDAVVVMDADLQDPPSLILEMVKKWEKGAKIVNAIRKKRKNDTLFKRLSANLYYSMLDNLSGKLKLEKNAANYKLLDRSVVEKIKSLKEVNPVFRVAVPFVGMKSETIVYERLKREKGKTKYNLKKMIIYAMDSLTGISIEPLHKIFFCFLVIFFTAIGLIILSLVTKETTRIIFAISGIIGLFVSMVCACLSLIAEYIGQIMIETKNRPQYIISEYIPTKDSKEK